MCIFAPVCEGQLSYKRPKSSISGSPGFSRDAYITHIGSIIPVTIEVQECNRQYLMIHFLTSKPFISNLQDIPPVNVFGPGSYVKRGFLMKLEMSQPLGQKKWRRRFCILTLDKMFLYDDEKSRGYEKHSEVIQLSTFQRCQRTSVSKTGGYFEFSLLDEEGRNKTTKRFFHHVSSSSVCCILALKTRKISNSGAT